VLQKEKPDFVCVLAKLLGYLEYDCKPGGSVKNAKSYLVILGNMIASLGQCKKCKKLLGYLGNMIASLCSV
jgi:hypothetical protein